MLKILLSLFINFKNFNNVVYNNYKSLGKKLESFKKDDFITWAETIVNFFYNDYIKELFNILRVFLGLKEHNDNNNKIFYIAELYSAYKSKISNLEFNYHNYNSKLFLKKRKRFIKWSNWFMFKMWWLGKYIYIYCELNIVLGNWKKAIMAAPHISIKNWEELT